MKLKTIFRSSTNLLLAALLTLNFSNCTEEEAPNNPAPILEVNDAQSTRREAVLTGEITGNANSIKGWVGFKYSTASSDLEVENGKADSIAVEKKTGTVTAHITGLTPNSTYYYRLCANSSRTKVMSPISSFTTDAVDIPTMDTLSVLNVGEYSIQVKCRVTDEGGANVNRKGFAYKIKGHNEERMINVQSFDGNDKSFSLLIEELSPETTYEIYAYAFNESSDETLGKSNTREIVTLPLTAPVLTTTEISAGNVGASWVKATGTITDIGASEVIERGFVYSSTEQKPTIDNGTKIKVEDTDKVFSDTISGLKENTTYYLRAYAVNGSSKNPGYGNVVTFKTTQFSTPTLGDVTIGDVTMTSVKLTAEITSTGNGLIIERGFYYSRTNTKPDEKDSHIVSTDGENKFTAILNDLEVGAHYYVRAYAKSQGETETYTGYSKTATEFTTENYTEPTFTELKAESITTSGANLSVLMDAGNVTITEKGFCYSKTNKNPDTAGSSVKSTDTGNNFTAKLSDLEGNTHYYYRAYAKYKTGAKEQTCYSNTQELDTEGYTAPTFSNLKSENVTQTTAKLSAVMDAGNVTIIEKGFCWDSNNSAPTVNNSKKAVEGAEFETTITGLTPNTYYYYRAYAIYQSGKTTETIYSPNWYIGTFQTTSIKVASLTNIVAEQQDDFTSVVVSSSISDNGDGTITEKGFCWSTTDAYPTVDNCEGVQKIALDKDFTHAMTNLKQNVTYYVRAYAKSAMGGATVVGYSNTQYVSPKQMTYGWVDTPTAVEVKATSFKVSSKVTDTGNTDVTEVGFCWTTNANEKVENIKNRQKVDMQEDGSISLEVTEGLKEKTTYYVYAYITNQAGTYYSSRRELTLKSVPGQGDIEFPDTVN